ncbi:uncharacterized protein LAESUDRAFT_578773 [Laetiporus sulphureus 93-53]|uniref:Uncharacterized protein n=1 Tax=Laetiporus sulphureus 93-53 TaxID=1314785 RepID=A0A165AZY5_9APHY|nr:uncharacterized protein LAESUDRAFT_578773 [Laetiporus sulphureus 93-53]KZS99969.1 hypothetical protein LAESUDRAFT_578773 [Laetiporus sulphureus 93-53]
MLALFSSGIDGITAGVQGATYRVLYSQTNAPTIAQPFPLLSISGPLTMAVQFCGHAFQAFISNLILQSIFRVLRTVCPDGHERAVRNAKPPRCPLLPPPETRQPLRATQHSGYFKDILSWLLGPLNDVHAADTGPGLAKNMPVASILPTSHWAASPRASCDSSSTALYKPTKDGGSSHNSRRTCCPPTRPLGACGDMSLSRTVPSSTIPTSGHTNTFHPRSTSWKILDTSGRRCPTCLWPPCIPRSINPTCRCIPLHI